MKDKLLVDIGNTRVHMLQGGKIVHISKERLFRQYGELGSILLIFSL
ncbi:MAG: hypothetical protein P8Y50_01060 [Sulfurovaceae bacterium]